MRLIVLRQPSFAAHTLDPLEVLPRGREGSFELVPAPGKALRQHFRRIGRPLPQELDRAVDQLVEVAQPAVVGGGLGGGVVGHGEGTPNTGALERLRTGARPFARPGGRSRA